MICYTDGACRGNGKDNAAGGFGVVVLDDNQNIVDLYSKQCEGTTNNREELKAILYVMLKYGKKEYNFVIYILFLISFIDIWLYTDSKTGLRREHITTYKLLCKNLHFYDLNDYIIIKTTSIIHRIYNLGHVVHKTI